MDSESVVWYGLVAAESHTTFFMYYNNYGVFPDTYKYPQNFRFFERSGIPSSWHDVV